MEQKNGDLTGRTLLLVNTGSHKKRFILQRLKKIGLVIICLNKEKNWGQPYVDHWILADTTNHTESLLAVREFITGNPQIKINGALTFWEDDILLTTKIIDRFNFIGINYHVAKRTRNKYLFREQCVAFGIRAPKHALLKTMRDAEELTKDFRFPVVIKPAYGSSSAYVTRVETQEELPATFEWIKKSISSRVESSLTDGLDILVEEYIDGDEVDIDLLLQNGKTKFWTISDNFDKSKGAFFIDRGQAVPTALPAKSQMELLEMAEETLEKLGIQNGCIHFEAKWTREGPVPLEINLRMGGDYVYSYIKSAWHVDLIEQAVHIACGDYIKIKMPEAPYKYVIGWDIHTEHSGVLVELDVKDEELKKQPYCEELHIDKRIGDPVLVPPEGHEYIGWVTVSGDNTLDAQDNLRKALSYIQYQITKFTPESSLGKTQRANRFSSAVLNKQLLQGRSKIEKIKRAALTNQRNIILGITYNSSNEEGEGNANFSSTRMAETLRTLGYEVNLFDFDNYPQVVLQMKDSNVDIMINRCEWINGNYTLRADAAAILETLLIPYSGSDAYTQSLCNDKIRIKKLFNFHNIPTPRWDYVYDSLEEFEEPLTYPIIVKPGITSIPVGLSNRSVVTNAEQLTQYGNQLLKASKTPLLFEEYIHGDEYAVHILGNNEGVRVLPLVRSIFKELPPDYWHIYTTEARARSDAAYESIVVQNPAKNISKKLETLITEIALDAYNMLDCKDYATVVIRVDAEDNSYVIDIDPYLRFDPHNNLISAAELIGLTPDRLFEEIIHTVLERYRV